MVADIDKDNLSINFESYKVFYLVAKLSSITQAAEYLYLTQPAVSKSIHHLEEALGCALFLRTQKGMALTKEGRELFCHISKAYHFIIEGQKRVTQMMNMEDGAIRVGTDEMTVHFDLLPLLEQFNRKYPNIKMEMSSFRRNDLLKELKQGSLDFGVVMCQEEVFENVEMLDLNTVHYCFIVGREYAQMQEKSWSLAEILEYPIISLAEDMSARKHLNDFFSENNLTFHPDIELTTTTLIVPFTERNLGVGIVARNFAEDALRAERIYQLKVNPPIPDRRTCIITDKRTPISIAARRFLSIIDGDDEKKL